MQDRKWKKKTAWRKYKEPTDGFWNRQGHSAKKHQVVWDKSKNKLDYVQVNA